MEEAITGLICRDIGGDHQQIGSRRTQYLGVTFKHTLLPIWVANYRYREQLFRVLINGETGRVAGDRPWSWWKITRLVLLIIFAILLVVVLVNMAKGSSKHTRMGQSPPQFADLLVARGKCQDGSPADGRWLRL
jgi:hypothetical protein